MKEQPVIEIESEVTPCEPTPETVKLGSAEIKRDDFKNAERTAKILEFLIGNVFRL